MKLDKHTIWVIVSVFAVILLIGLFIHGHHMENSSATDINHAKQTELADHQKDTEKHHRVKKDLFGHALTSPDAIIKTIAINNDDNTTIHKPFLKFFKVFYNWKDEQQYINRPNKLKNIATPQLLKNKQFFNNNKNGSNEAQIKNQQLNNEFNDLNLFIISHKGNNIDVMADVQYDQWHTNTDNQSTSESWYEMNYNTQQHKITSMKNLFSKDNVPNNNS